MAPTSKKVPRDQTPSSRRRTLAQIEIEQKFMRAARKVKNTNCDHKHYNFKEHGRFCTCGTAMSDLGN